MLVLHSHMPYVLSHGKSPHGTDWLDESAAECYLPLLSALKRLAADGVRPRWTVNITPILAEQLEDESWKAGFISYCEEKEAFAKEDGARFLDQSEPAMAGLAEHWRRFYERARREFSDDWNRSIVDGFASMQREGLIEIITAGATHGYQPLLGTDESCQAQVRLGASSYERRFGSKPRGIWLPECAYRPAYEWKAPVQDGEPPFNRLGTDEILALEGIEYFFVDSHMIRGGAPLGTYGAKFPQLAELFARSAKGFTPPEEERSEYEHYRLPSGVTVFARDPQTTVKVWSGEVGYPGDPMYLEFHKQLYPGRLKYWRISEEKDDLGKKRPYEPFRAYERIGDHARDMVHVIKGTLADYRGRAGREGTIVAMYDTELFGHWWHEGPEFLYLLGRELARDGEVRMMSGGDVLDEEAARHTITLPEGSWGEGGYHHIWLNEDNAWTWERLYRAERTLRLLLARPIPSERMEILRQAARELLLAEASDWQFLISTRSARDYAELRFTDHLDRFERLAEIAARALDGAEPTTEEMAFVEDCRRKDAPFAELDLDLWKPYASASPS